MKGIIYKATNTLNGKVYIGQTEKSLEERKRQHEIASKNPKNMSPFYGEMRYYGARAFRWEVVKEVPFNPQESYGRTLRREESRVIEEYRSFEPKFGYNIQGAPSGDHATCRHTTERTVWIHEIPSGRYVGVFDSLCQARNLLGGKSAVYDRRLDEFSLPKHLVVEKGVKYVGFSPIRERVVSEYFKKHLAIRVAPGKLEWPGREDSVAK